MRNICDRSDIGKIQCRIADGLDIDGPGFFCDSPIKAFRIGGVGKIRADAKLWQDTIEHGIGAAVKVAGGYDFITGLTDVDNRIINR